MFYVNIDGVDYPSNNLPPTSNNVDTVNRRERRKRSKMNVSDYFEYIIEEPKCMSKKAAWAAFKKKSVELAPLPKAVPLNSPVYGGKAGWCIFDEYEQEGKTPMHYNDNYASANACVQSPASDATTQRDYFLARLSSAFYPKDTELSVLFNLHVDNTPKTYKDMIDAIKGDKYTIDPKVEKQLANTDDDEDNYWSPLHGIIWNGPQPDRDGYNKAREEMKKQKTAATDTIMSGDAAAMKAAVEAFEAWLPTPATATAQ